MPPPQGWSIHSFPCRYGIATMKLSALALLAIPAVSAFSPAATGREF